MASNDMEDELPTQHIDFKFVRANADIVAVAEHYGCNVEKDGRKEGQYRCLCPFHDDHKPSLKLNNERNIFNCFPCGKGGNVLDFVMLIEDVEIRPAAKLVAEICGIETYGGGRRSPPQKPKERPKAANDSKPNRPPPASPDDEADEDWDGAVSNPPLTFELKNLITDHPWLKERGLGPSEIREFGLGIASRGVMKDRLVFPIHDVKSRLVAYCGRYVGDDIPEDEMKYKLPKRFRKELELFNLHRALEIESESPVVIVESFFAAIVLHMLGYQCVALMGRSISAKQMELLKEAGVGEVILLLDGDDPGRLAVMTIGRQLLAHGLEVTAPVVAEDFKPHRLGIDQLLSVLRS